MPNLSKVFNTYPVCVCFSTTFIFVRVEKPLKQYLHHHRALKKISTESQTNKWVSEGFNNIVLQHKDFFGQRSDGDITQKQSHLHELDKKC